MPPQWLTTLKEQALNAFQRYTYLKLIVFFISGSSVFAFVSEFSTYNFAFWYGIRMPAEGVPYLKITVFLIAISVFAVIFLAYFIIKAILIGLLNYIQSVHKLNSWLYKKFPKYGSLDDGLKVEEIMAEFSNLLILGLTVLVPLFFYLTAVIVLGVGGYCDGLSCFNHGKQSFIYLLIALFVLVIGRPKWIKRMAVIASILATVTVLWYVFSPSKYAEFLRFAGFGGGKPVSVYMLDTDSKSETRIDGGLLIRSNDYLTIYSERTQSSLEIPMPLVRKIEYGNSSKNAILP
ncbi:hypothetical protein BZG04_15245 [Salinivibrio kushneri]|uniref:hypothetical protein n=1 Tax=Salinivibrio kushneri TaxID=1908198 RepID=UPI0009892424|nr:hypothetical protein [Salinivibrio kushneri]OOE32416.1 hypothetical protein BZG04_15245 [Salinivibrio kushneri]